MSDEAIRSLLRQADQAGVPPSAPPDLAGRVMRLAARRRRRKAALGALSAAACLAIAVAAAALLRPDAPGTADPGERAAQLRQEIARLDLRAQTTLAVAEHMIALEAQRRAAPPPRPAPAPDPERMIQQEMDKAAWSMVQLAARMSVVENRREEAMATYRRTIALFPKTAWAVVARQQLRKAFPTEEI